MVANSESGPTTPRRADAVANRKRLLDAARKAFAELGTNAEVKDIAERAGVALGTIYRHFANKEDLLHAVVVEAVAEIERNTQEAIGCDDRPLEALRHYLAALLKATDTYGWLFDAAIGGHLPEPVIDGLDDHSPHAQLIDLLANGIQRGALAPGLDLPVAATMLLGLTVSWKYGPLRELMSLDDAVDRTLQVFLAGAASREA